MDRHSNEAKAMNDKLKAVWDKAKMDDFQRAITNSYACGLMHGMSMQRGEKNDERKQIG